MENKAEKVPVRMPRAWQKRTGSCAVFIAIAFFSSVSLAIDIAKAAGNTETVLPEGDLRLASLKMAAALVIVIGIIVVLFYLSKRFGGGRFSLNGSPAMRVIGSLSLAPKRSIALVEVCGEWLVLGIGTETITLLGRVEVPPTIDDMIPSENGAHCTFKSLLMKKVRRPPQGTGSASERDGNSL